MTKKSLLTLGLAAVLAAGLLAGCGDAPAPVPSAAPETPAPTAQPPVLLETTEPAKPPEPPEADAPFSFADLADLEFWFGSGAGGWCTVLYVHEDGSFEGWHVDSEMGAVGDEYPHGMRYECGFTGTLTRPERVDGYTYSATLEQIELEREPETWEIRGGVKIVYTTPYGLDGAQELRFYLPGAPVDALPEGYRNWMGGRGDEIGAELPFYGLYNVSGEQGFSSHKRATIDDELADLEAQAAELDRRLETEFTQAEMTEIAAERYRLWDGALNSLWARLKERLDPQDMAALTAEELAWIAEKEAGMQAAGADVEGGTLEPLVEYGAGAELTRARVYELAEYLR